MGALLTALDRFALWLLAAAGGLGLLSLIGFWLAYQRQERTPFGLEKDAARRRQNWALAGLVISLVVSGLIFSWQRYGVPQAAGAAGTQVLETATPRPTATPIRAPGPIQVDSSGCLNPAVTLQRPAAGERLNGPVEVRGSASLPNFAFYRIEISGAATSGAWVTLIVGNTPQVKGILGIFDTSPYQPGDYAFRLVVTDNVGQTAPACVIAVTFVGAALPAATP